MFLCIFMIGIDEAGRGPVIGPMVIAGVQLDKDSEAKLKALGVRDSKRIAPKKREVLAKEIRKLAKKVEVVVVTAKQIDELMQLMTLNQIELNAMVKIMNEIGDVDIFLDLPSNGPGFMRELRSKLKVMDANVVAEHKADDKYVVVGAASIIAKTTRDRLVREIEEKHGTLGSGYPADERTVNFLKKYLKEHGDLPDFVRHSWSTTQKLLGKKKQKGLFEYKK